MTTAKGWLQCNHCIGKKLRKEKDYSCRIFSEFFTHTQRKVSIQLESVYPTQWSIVNTLVIVVRALLWGMVSKKRRTGASSVRKKYGYNVKVLVNGIRLLKASTATIYRLFGWMTLPYLSVRYCKQYEMKIVLCLEGVWDFAIYVPVLMSNVRWAFVRGNHTHTYLWGGVFLQDNHLY